MQNIFLSINITIFSGHGKVGKQGRRGRRRIQHRSGGVNEGCDRYARVARRLLYFYLRQPRAAEAKFTEQVNWPLSRKRRSN